MPSVGNGFLLGDVTLRVVAASSAVSLKLLISRLARCANGVRGWISFIQGMLKEINDQRLALWEAPLWFSDEQAGRVNLKVSPSHHGNFMHADVGSCLVI